MLALCWFGIDPNVHTLLSSSPVWMVSHIRACAACQPALQTWLARQICQVAQAPVFQAVLAYLLGRSNSHAVGHWPEGAQSASDDSSFRGSASVAPEVSFRLLHSQRSLSHHAHIPAVLREKAINRLSDVKPCQVA